MSLLNRIRKQTACVWIRTGSDKKGTSVYAAVKEIQVRWDNEQQEVVTAKGVSVISRASVIVGEAIPVGSMISNSSLVNLLDPAVPRNNVDTYEVLAYQETPNMKATGFLREVLL